MQTKLESNTFFIHSAVAETDDNLVDASKVLDMLDDGTR